MAPLAAGRAQVFAEVINHLNVGARLALEFKLNLQKLVRDQAQDTTSCNSYFFFERDRVT
jgi:hypothetical protein